MTFDENSFVGYYSKHKISPVNQDLSDIDKHFSRRDSLFRTLGIVPTLVEGKTFLEFGPGSGHNSLYTASLEPSKFTLVEGNPVGFKETQKRLSSIGGLNYKIYNHDFWKFKEDETYDFVWAEGCLPFQNSPTQLLKHIAEFVRCNGLFVITTVDTISYYSETLRRLLRFRFFDNLNPDPLLASEQLSAFYEPHLKSLKGMSRPIKDWILDSILQPFSNRFVLSIPDAINALKNRFDVYCSSPNFVNDWRWYKDIVGKNRKFNENFISEYYCKNLNLLDYREVYFPHSIAFGTKLEKLTQEFYNLSIRVENGETEHWSDIYNNSVQVCDHIKCYAPNTVCAIKEVIRMLKVGSSKTNLKYFTHLWGRGQQYLSFIKKKKN